MSAFSDETLRDLLARISAPPPPSSLRFASGIGVLDALHGAQGMRAGDAVELCGEGGSGKTLALMHCAARMLAHTYEQAARRARRRAHEAVQPGRLPSPMAASALPARVVFIDCPATFSTPHFARLLASTLAVRAEERRRRRGNAPPPGSGAHARGGPLCAGGAPPHTKRQHGSSDADLVYLPAALEACLMRLELYRPRSSAELLSLLAGLVGQRGTGVGGGVGIEAGAAIALMCIDGMGSSWHWQDRARTLGLDDARVRTAANAALNGAASTAQGAATTCPGLCPSPLSSAIPLLATQHGARSIFELQAQLAHVIAAVRDKHGCRIMWSRDLLTSGAWRVNRALHAFSAPQHAVAGMHADALITAVNAAEVVHSAACLASAQGPSQLDALSGPTLCVSGSHACAIALPPSANASASALDFTVGGDFGGGGGDGGGRGSIDAAKRASLRASAPGAPVSAALLRAAAVSTLPHHFARLVTAQVVMFRVRPSVGPASPEQPSGAPLQSLSGPIPFPSTVFVALSSSDASAQCAVRQLQRHPLDISVASGFAPSRASRDTNSTQPRMCVTSAFVARLVPSSDSATLCEESGLFSTTVS